MTFDPRDERAMAQSLGELVRGSLDRPWSEEAARKERFLARTLGDTGRRRTQAVWMGVPALAVAAALVLWLLTPRALRYEVTGATSGEYVSAPADKPAKLRFSDDSSIDVGKGSQLRVADTSRTGARVLLERGSLSVHVAHRERAEWTFVAGPYEVRVTGTRFDLAWDPARDVLELSLREGSVEVASPLSQEPVTVRAGQDFHAESGKQSLVQAGSRAARSAETPALEPASVPALEPALPSAAPSVAPRAPAPSARLSWSELVAAGRFDEVLAEASAAGTPSCAVRCSAADLGALADAARYRGRVDVADQSLRALRERFAGSSAGRSAAFMLGRLREERGASADAKGWYERYLSEAPGGTYAAEALAGKMRTTASVSGRDAAAPAARDYLKLYPGGVHAKTARGILGQP